MFEVTIQFDEKQFKKKEFNTSNEWADKDKDFFVSHHNSGNARRKEHSHLAIILDKKDSQLRTVFLEGRWEEDADEDGEKLSEISLEDSIINISPFFKQDEFKATLQAIFKFNKAFEPVIKIRYPLLAKSKLLQNAEISGHEITFSNDSMSGKFLILANKEGDISILFNATAKISLSTFNPHIEIKRAVNNVQPLLKRKGKKDNEKNNS